MSSALCHVTLCRLTSHCFTLCHLTLCHLTLCHLTDSYVAAAGHFALTVAAVVASKQYVMCMWASAPMTCRHVILLQAMTIGTLAAKPRPSTKFAQDCMYLTLGEVML